jgi:DNA-binding GntR family transcriptional regulator
MKFQPLQQRTTPDGVYRVLRDAILDGSLTAGSQLREAHIAADMGISRAPLREALTKLEEDGLIHRIPYRGAFVSEVSGKTIEEIASVRFLVEPYAAELSAEALRGPYKAELEQAVEAMHQANRTNDIAASIDAHLQFHRLFYEHSGHELLRDMWTSWESKLRVFLAADHRSFTDLEEIAAAHEKLAGLVFYGDLDAFRHELAHHVHSAPGAALDEQSNAPSFAHEAKQTLG